MALLGLQNPRVAQFRAARRGVVLSNGVPVKPSRETVQTVCQTAPTRTVGRRNVGLTRVPCARCDNAPHKKHFTI